MIVLILTRCAEHPHVKEMIVNAHGSVKVKVLIFKRLIDNSR